MNKFLFICLFFTSGLCAQDYTNNPDALKLCSVLSLKNFNPDPEVENALNKILGVIGVSKRFVLQPCSNINNAAATSYKGIRYILYDKEFIRSINENNWKNIFIMAHEVGHHINGHSLDLVLYAVDAVKTITLEESRLQELEADKFGGFILAKLGGDLSSVIQFISSISSNSDDTYSTHPSLEKRLAAINEGFKNGAGDSFNNFEEASSNSKAEEFLYRGLNQYNEGDYKGAIERFSNAIKTKPDFAQAYSARGQAKLMIEDLNGAKKDCEKAIKIKPDLVHAYITLGRVSNKKAIQELFRDQKHNYYDSAIMYYTKAIELDPENGEAYMGRGFSLNNNEQYEAALEDLSKSIDYLSNDWQKAEAYIGRAAVYKWIKWEKAEEDYTKAIELEPNELDFIIARAMYREGGKNFNGAFDDYTRAIELKPEDSDLYLRRAYLRLHHMNDTIGSCNDFDKYAELVGGWPEWERGKPEICK